RQQLAERERLHEVVVAAGAQPLDAIIDTAERAQDQGRGPDLRAAQRTEQAKPVHARQHAVENDRVVAARGGQEQPLAAVPGLVDGVAALVEPFDQIGGGFAIVFDDEEFHQTLGKVLRSNSVRSMRINLSLRFFYRVWARSPVGNRSSAKAFASLTFRVNG